MKILFTTSHFGFLRNFEPTIRILAERGHTIHLVADRGEHIGGTRTVEGLVRDHPSSILGDRVRAGGPGTLLEPVSDGLLIIGDM